MKFNNKYTDLFDILKYINNIESLELRIDETKRLAKENPGLIEFFKLIYSKDRLSFNDIDQITMILPLARKRKSELDFNKFFTTEIFDYVDGSNKYRKHIKVAKLAQAIDLFSYNDAKLISYAIFGVLDMKAKRINHILLELAFPEIFSKN